MDDEGSRRLKFYKECLGMALLRRRRGHEALGRRKHSRWGTHRCMIPEVALRLEQ